MPINVVTPKNRERLVPVTTAIIIDFMSTTIAEVKVNDVVVHNGSGALAGWMAISLTRPGGTRVVLDPPAPFAIGDVVKCDIIANDQSEQSILFQTGLKPITSSDDASTPRLIEDGTDRPWITYNRVPGNVYARKDEPLTAEILLVPGDNVDIGYNDVDDKVEVVYINNGKVFIVTADSADEPSTLTQPSVLKNDFKTGSTGDSELSRFTTQTFNIAKASATENMICGNAGNSDLLRFSLPPNPPAAIAFIGQPVSVVISPVNDATVSFVQLLKVSSGASVVMAELQKSTELITFQDYAYVDGDRYFTRLIYGDQGSPATRKLSVGSTPNLATPGDLVTTGMVGSSEVVIISLQSFSPLKFAPSPEPVVTGEVGSHGEWSSSRNWFPAAGTTASLQSAIGGHIVAIGLSNMGRQHLGLLLTITGAANSLNNSSMRIVEIISSSSVRVSAGNSPGNDSSNGALVWSVTDVEIGTAKFISKNTLNIGVG